MGITGGKWEVFEDDFGYSIKAEQSIVSGFSEDADIEIASMNAYIDESEPKANAHLIATVVNACVSVNPDNPLAVAESITAMVEALKVARTLLREAGYHTDLIDQVLTKEEER